MNSRAVKRLQKELQKLNDNPPPPEVVLRPDDVDIFTWYFVFHKLDGDFTGGQYLGKMVFPKNYPDSAPKLYMITPSGRFQVNTTLCTTFSSYHNDQWSPLWDGNKMAVALLSFFTQPISDDNTRGIGRIISTPDQRKKFAKESRVFNSNNKIFIKLFSDLISEETNYEFINDFIANLSDDEIEYLSKKISSISKSKACT